MGSKTFRTELFEGYKANRSEPPIELLPQFDLAKEIVEAFNVPNIGLEGFEADDCIGTLAKQSCQHVDVLILTGDQDILQLIDDNISVALLKKVSEIIMFIRKSRFLRKRHFSTAND